MATVRVVEEVLRAHEVSLGACGGKCSVHIMLHGEDGQVYADAPLTPEMALSMGTKLVRIGQGEPVEKVLDPWPN